MARGMGVNAPERAFWLADRWLGRRMNDGQKSSATPSL